MTIDEKFKEKFGDSVLAGFTTVTALTTKIITFDGLTRIYSLNINVDSAVAGTTQYTFYFNQGAQSSGNQSIQVDTGGAVFTNLWRFLNNNIMTNMPVIPAGKCIECLSMAIKNEDSTRTLGVNFTYNSLP